MTAPRRVENAGVEELAAADFDALLTADQNLEHQQNLGALPIAVVVQVAPTNRIESLRPRMPALVQTLETLAPGPAGSRTHLRSRDSGSVCVRAGLGITFSSRRRVALTEELEVLKIVAGRLESAQIPYMVTGSIAVNYYAVPRMTRDIDLVVELSADDADRLCALFAGDFYVDRSSVGRAIANRGTFNLIHYEHVIKVDFVVRKDTEYRRHEFRRRRRVTIDALMIFIATPEDLIISKLDWARDSRSEVQLADVRNLLGVAPLDLEYVTRWVAALGLEGLYREVAG